MPFARPDLPTLIDRAIADIESRLPGADARLRRSNLNVLARTHAGATHGLYGLLIWAARQIMPDQSDEEILERQASLWLPGGRVPAAYAIGAITVTGTNGTAIEVGTVFKRADGKTYTSTAEVSIAGTTADVPVVADETGQSGNAAAGTALNLDSPIAGINAAGVVAAIGLTGGADIEDVESLRARVLARIRQTPHGGARHDYVAWAKEVPGVTRAWCYPLEMGDGTVTVRFVRDDDVSAIPDGAEVTAMHDYLETKRPVAGELFVSAPVAMPINFTITISPATLAVKAAVEASLRDLLLREAVPQGGDIDGTILLSHLREAISLAAGEADNSLISPIADVSLLTGQIATFGSITWV